jgi:hypothetical protein
VGAAGSSGLGDQFITDGIPISPGVVMLQRQVAPLSAGLLA